MLLFFSTLWSHTPTSLWLPLVVVVMISWWSRANRGRLEPGRRAWRSWSLQCLNLRYTSCFHHCNYISIFFFLMLLNAKVICREEVNNKTIQTTNSHMCLQVKVGKRTTAYIHVHKSQKFLRALPMWRGLTVRVKVGLNRIMNALNLIYQNTPGTARKWVQVKFWKSTQTYPFSLV